MTTLTWGKDQYDEGFVADSTLRVPKGAPGAYYWVEDSTFNPGGLTRNPGWSLRFVVADGGEEKFLGLHADPENAKAAAERYEQTGEDPAEVRPAAAIFPVITYDAPDPGQRPPNPQAVRDGEGRIRVWDSVSDRYGWAALNITWEPILPAKH